MNSCFMLNCLKFHHITHDTTASMQYAPASTLCSQKNDILVSRLIVCCKLAPTLARQILRHNDVIGHNDYLISTLSECTFPWVYLLQFLFKSTHHHSWRYERKCEWVFFSEHSLVCNGRTQAYATTVCRMKKTVGRKTIRSLRSHVVCSVTAQHSEQVLAVICLNLA